MEIKELNETLKLINENLKGIKEELNYMNGVEVLNDGTKMSRDAWKELNVGSMRMNSAVD